MIKLIDILSEIKVVPKDLIKRKFESLKRGDVIFFNYKDVRSESFTITDKVIYPNSSHGEVGSLRIGQISSIHFYFELPSNDRLNQQALSVKKVNELSEIKVVSPLRRKFDFLNIGDKVSYKLNGRGSWDNNDRTKSFRIQERIITDDKKAGMIRGEGHYLFFYFELPYNDPKNEEAVTVKKIDNTN